MDKRGSPETIDKRRATMWARHGRKSALVICQFCGKTYRAFRRTVKRGTRFCNRTCKNLSLQAAPEVPKRAIRPCETCGKTFVAQWFAGSHSYQRFCSRVCRNKALSISMLGPTNPRRKLRTECICANCKKSFTKYPSRISTATNRKRDFCSRHCANVYLHANPAVRTDIEILMAAALKKANIPFREQISLYGRWIVDFVVDDWDLIIFCDGEYWHNKPEVSRKDRGQTNYLKKCGWNVLRLPGNDIKTKMTACMKRIRAYRPPAGST